MGFNLGHKSMIIECRNCGKEKKLLRQRSFGNYMGEHERCECTLPGLITDWIVYPEQVHTGPEPVPGAPW